MLVKSHSEKTFKAFYCYFLRIVKLNELVK